MQRLEKRLVAKGHTRSLYDHKSCNPNDLVLKKLLVALHNELAAGFDAQAHQHLAVINW